MKYKHQFSSFTDKRPSIAERVNRAERILLNKSVLEKGNADWISEFSSVVKQYNNATHHGIEITPNQASKKMTTKSFQIFKTTEENLNQNLD